MPERFRCETCGREFTLADSVAARYPGWKPRQCQRCRSGRTPASTGKPSQDHSGPQTGIFTDGGCDPNPGAGGWAAVRVAGGEVTEERFGREAHSTNNRMELTALIAAYEMAGEDEAVTIYSDSRLCVRTVNEWAADWERRGWVRKGGPIANLDLVQRLYALAKLRPRATLEWLAGHAGHTWNEYADALVKRAREGTGT